jgi:hypothetical protein
VPVLLPCGDENDFLVDSTDAPGLAFDMEWPDYLHHPRKTSAHLHLHSDNDRDADRKTIAPQFERLAAKISAGR